jgi:hypothetical protein
MNLPTRRRGSVVGIAPELRAGLPRGQSPSPGKVKNFLFSMSSRPGVKLPGREADHSPPASAEAKKMWIYTSAPPYAFMA